MIDKEDNMKQFKFFRGHNLTLEHYNRTINPDLYRVVNVANEQKHIAVICSSGAQFHQFHRQQRRMCGLPEDTDFLHSRFIVGGDYYYFIGRPEDVNGLIFTHYYYYNFNVSDNPWAITIVEYLVHRFNLLPYVEPNRVNV